MARSKQQIPDQDGRVIVVTGGNSGIGAVAAGQLAARGARVVLACRDVSKGEKAAAEMPGTVRVLRLDLADLSSVRAFAATFEDEVGTAQVLVNNAGVMAVPQATTVDGFELQLGTNFLGPFALTGLLLPHLTERVVTLSSVLHRRGRIDLDDLNWEHRRYARWGAYAQSKLADLLFARELQRRLAATGSGLLSVAAHPGIATTQLTTHTGSRVQNTVLSLSARMAGHSAELGAQSLLYAVTDPDVAPGGYYGPTGPGEMRGPLGPAASSSASQDETVATELWLRAEELTGVSYP